MEFEFVKAPLSNGDLISPYMPCLVGGHYQEIVGAGLHLPETNQ
jgi:hypothetical protein